MPRLRYFPSLAIACTLALTPLGVTAQTDAEHAQHHPQASASKPANAASKPTASGSTKRDTKSGASKGKKSKSKGTPTTK